MTVICGSRAQRFEKLSPRSQCPQIAAPRGAIFASQCTESFNSSLEARKSRIDDGIGPKCWQNASLPSGLAKRHVIHKSVQRRISGCKYLDLESLVQCTRQKLRRRKLRFNRFVIV